MLKEDFVMQVKNVLDLTSYKRKANAVVDKQFTGEDGEVFRDKKTYKSIQRAVDSADSIGNQPFVIYIKKGIYYEKLDINKPSITLVGEDRDETVVTYDVASGSKRLDGSTYGTFGSSSVTVWSENFSAMNVTFENAFDYLSEVSKSEDDHSKVKNVQAVAFRTAESSNQTQLKQCRFRSYQDTLLTDKGTHFIEDCIIEGAVDFIFGGGQAVFENCTIISLDRGSEKNNGYITAASTLITQPYGFLFANCKLVKETDDMADQSVYLGRPWHPGGNPDAQGNVLFKNCDLGSHIKAEGWAQMSGFSPMDARLYEYGSKGAGAIDNKIRRKLSEREVEEYTIENVLGHRLFWN